MHEFSLKLTVETPEKRHNVIYLSSVSLMSDTYLGSCQTSIVVGL